MVYEGPAYYRYLASASGWAALFLVMQHLIETPMVEQVLLGPSSGALCALFSGGRMLVIYVAREHC